MNFVIIKILLENSSLNFSLLLCNKESASFLKNYFIQWLIQKFKYNKVVKSIKNEVIYHIEGEKCELENCGGVYGSTRHLVGKVIMTYFIHGPIEQRQFQICRTFVTKTPV